MHRFALVCPGSRALDQDQNSQGHQYNLEEHQGTVWSRIMRPQASAAFCHLQCKIYTQICTATNTVEVWEQG